MSDKNEIIIDVGKDALTEMFSDVVKENGLGGIPVVSALFGAIKLVDSMRDKIFYHKVTAFFKEVSVVTLDDHIQMLDDLEDNPFKDRIGNVIINYIDRCDGKEKARLQGLAFQALLKAKYDKNTWAKICHGIDAIPTIAMRDFFDAFKVGGGGKPEAFNFMPIASSGLLDVTMTFGGLKLTVNQIGSDLIDHVLVDYYATNTASEPVR